VRAAVLVVALAAAGVGAWLAVRAHRRTQHAHAWQRLAQAAADVDRCMIGEPLGPGEKYQDRLARITLGNRPPDATDPWPQRCLPDVDELETALHADELDLAMQDRNDLDIVADRARTAIKDTANEPDYWFRYTLPQDLAKLDLPKHASTVRPPPPPAESIGPLQAIGRQYDWDRRDTQVLVWSDSSACEIAIASGKATCAPSADPGTALPQLEPDSAPELQLAGLGADYGLYRLAGGAPLSHRTRDGVLFDGVSSGAGYALVSYGAGAELVRSQGDTVERTKLPIPDDAHVAVVGPYLVWRAGPAPHLYIQRVVTVDRSVGPVIDAGPSAGDWRPQLCVANGWSALDDGEVLGFLSEHGWQPVRDAPKLGVTVVMTCGTHSVGFAWVDDRVHAVSCTESGCGSEQRSAPLAKQNLDVVRAAVFGDQILLAYRDNQGTWMRLAPIAHLDTAHEILLKQPAASVLDIFTSASGALLLVDVQDGIAAIRVDAGGKATAVSAPR
jgi:hypothetical protein